MRTVKELINDLFETHPSIVKEAISQLGKKGEKSISPLSDLLLERLKRMKKGDELSPVTENIIDALSRIKLDKIKDILYQALEKAIELDSIELIDKIIYSFKYSHEKVPYKYYTLLNQALELAILSENYEMASDITTLFKDGGDWRTVTILRKTKLKQDKSNLTQYREMIKLSMAVESSIKSLPKTPRPVDWQMEEMFLEWK